MYFAFDKDLPNNRVHEVPFSEKAPHRNLHQNYPIQKLDST